MIDLLSLFLSFASQGVLQAPLTIDVYVTFRILDITDLTAEGNFPSSAGIAAVSITNGYCPLTVCLLGFLGGMAAGLVSGLLHTKLKIPALLAGIITVTDLYSATSHLMGVPNISLLGQLTVFHWAELFGITEDDAVLTVGLLFALIVVCLLILLLRTETGLTIRVTDDNLAISEADRTNTDDIKIIGYMISNGCITLSGSLLTQNNGFVDLNSGIGTTMIGLVSIITAEVLSHDQPLLLRPLTVALDAVIYRFILALASELNVKPGDSKLASAFALVVCLSFPQIRQKFHLSQKKEGGSVR